MKICNDKGLSSVAIMNRGIACNLSNPIYHNAAEYNHYVEFF